MICNGQQKISEQSALAHVEYGNCIIPNGVGPAIRFKFNIVAYSGNHPVGQLVTDGGSTYLSLKSNNSASRSDTTAWQPVVRSYYATGGNGTPQGIGFRAQDIGRQIRVFSEPPEWATGTSYAQGSFVTYQGVQWTALEASTGHLPGSDPNAWVVAAGKGEWRYGKITDITPDVTTDFGVTLDNGVLLYNTEICQWQLGVYDLLTWPSNGKFHQGRLWLSSLNNHFDASCAGTDTLFSPTEPDGTVTAANALSEYLDDNSEEPILWFQPTKSGIMAGTINGEWVIEGPGANNVVAPDNIDANNEGQFGSSSVEPVMAGAIPVFVHRSGRAIYETLRDTYSGQLIPLPLTDYAKELVEPGIKDLIYTRANSPIIWMVCNDGSLVGTTYRRDRSRIFGTEAPLFNGFHHHEHGAGDRKFISGAACKSFNNNGDSLSVITEDSAGRCRVEFMADQMNQTDDIFNCNFLDGFVVAPGGSFVGRVAEEVITPPTPGYWSCPGYDLITTCPLTVESSAADAATDIATRMTALPFPEFQSVAAGGGFPAGLPIWVSKPSQGGGGGCGALTFTAYDTVAGSVDDHVLGPGDPGGFDIFAFSTLYAFGHATKWFAYQGWVRRLDSPDAVPSQPAWVESSPGTLTVTTSGTATGISLSGLSNFEGNRVAAFIAGIDCGDFPVIGGKISVPYGCVPEFTEARVQYVSSLDRDWRDLSCNFQGFKIPAIIGYRYKSRGQRLRPVSTADTGTQAGPGFGKKRRNHKYAVLLQRSGQFSVGTDFAAMKPANLSTDGGKTLSKTDLYSGMHKDVLGDDSTLDGMIAWEADGPWPLNICAIGGFLATSDE